MIWQHRRLACRHLAFVTISQLSDFLPTLPICSSSHLLNVSLHFSTSLRSYQTHPHLHFGLPPSPHLALNVLTSTVQAPFTTRLFDLSLRTDIFAFSHLMPTSNFSNLSSAAVPWLLMPYQMESPLPHPINFSSLYLALSIRYCLLSLTLIKLWEVLVSFALTRSGVQLQIENKKLSFLYSQWEEKCVLITFEKYFSLQLSELKTRLELIFYQSVFATLDFSCRDANLM